jgi:cytochrome c oxidase cbb3-type subunit III
MKQFVLILLSIALAGIASCKREERNANVEPPAADTISTKTVSDLHPAGAQRPTPVVNHYEDNAYAVNQGEKLFSAFNCTGCHFHGGGGIGPALMDTKWVYGDEPQQIFASIVEGRPNGMPSFRGKIADYQAWQIVAYVRALGGVGNIKTAPGRSDEMSNALPPNSSGQQTPVNSNLPNRP